MHRIQTATLERMTKTAGLLAFVLLAYLLGSAIDQQQDEENARVERAQAARIAEAYRRGVSDGEGNEKFRQAQATARLSDSR